MSAEELLSSRSRSLVMVAIPDRPPQFLWQRSLAIPHARALARCIPKRSEQDSTRLATTYFSPTVDDTWAVIALASECPAFMITEIMRGNGAGTLDL